MFFFTDFTKIVQASAEASENAVFSQDYAEPHPIFYKDKKRQAENKTVSRL
jgi:hypothetical protein